MGNQHTKHGKTKRSLSSQCSAGHSVIANELVRRSASANPASASILPPDEDKVMDCEHAIRCHSFAGPPPIILETKVKKSPAHSIGHDSKKANDSGDFLSPDAASSLSTRRSLSTQQLNESNQKRRQQKRETNCMI
ncbi:unnamed protein product [Anisakis simplex]|uniref:Uncharacterized protein n=1 Tax=Anisakis simplex TaxID=6269 RepID=A0A0M3K781_ANISI|nr:unnamed protein product [Anisakis simplex]